MVSEKADIQSDIFKVKGKGWSKIYHELTYLEALFKTRKVLGTCKHGDIQNEATNNCLEIVR